MSLQQVRANFSRYLESNHSDVSMVAPDAVYTNMATGEETRGVDAIREMLRHIYNVAFDAHAETITTIVTEDHALLEGYFVGRQIGEFAGIPATNRDVRVPLAVIYDLENAMIKRARIYMQVPVMIAQLTGQPAGAA
jgi:predicted ester cyclase